MPAAPGAGRTVLGRFDGEFADGYQYSRHEVTVAAGAVDGPTDSYALELAVEPAAAPERAVVAEVPAGTLRTVRGALADERGYARVSLSGAYREGGERTPGTVTLVARGPDGGSAELELSFDPAAAGEKAVTVELPRAASAPPVPDPGDDRLAGGGYTSGEAAEGRSKALLTDGPDSAT